VLIFGWSFWAWRERRREQRRLDRGDPAPTADTTGWRTVLGFPMGQSPKEAARLKALEEEAYRALRQRDDRGDGHTEAP